MRKKSLYIIIIVILVAILLFFGFSKLATALNFTDFEEDLGLNLDNETSPDVNDNSDTTINVSPNPTETETTKTEEVTTNKDNLYEINFDYTISPYILPNDDVTYFLFTKNIMSLKDMNNQTIWDFTYAFNKIHAVSSFGYVAVTELLSDNSVVHVFDGNGLMYSLTDIEGQVSYISINNSGYLSIITNINEEYQVKVLNDKGELFLISDFKDGTTVPITCA
ncbi:MAG: DUF5711 family protein, partial [Lachnospirales bacterium]